MTTLATPNDVTTILRAVIDPELGSDIVDLGMVKNVEVTPDGLAKITIALTTMGCPLRAQIKQDAVQRVGTLEGIEDVEVDWTVLTSEEKAETMARARKRIAENPPDTAISMTTRVLLIASGKGGVGKSTVTVNLAAALATEGYNVGVLDADIWGFSVPRMLGVEGRLEGEMPDDLELGKTKILPLEKPCPPGSLKIVSMGLLVESEETALMWRGLILNRAVRHFLEDVSWGDLDYLLVDMPPGTGDVQMGIAKMLPRADMVVITTPSKSAQKVAVRAANMGLKNYLRIAGVIENMSGAVVADGSLQSVFGEGGGEALAAEVKAPLIGKIPLDRAIAEASDMGEPVTLGAATGSGLDGDRLAGDGLDGSAGDGLDGSGLVKDGLVNDGSADNGSNGSAANGSSGLAGELLSASGLAAKQAFEEVARRITQEIAPPLNMSACTARLLPGGMTDGVPVQLGQRNS